MGLTERPFKDLFLEFLSKLVGMARAKFVNFPPEEEQVQNPERESSSNEAGTDSSSPLWTSPVELPPREPLIREQGGDAIPPLQGAASEAATSNTFDREDEPEVPMKYFRNEKAHVNSCHHQGHWSDVLAVRHLSKKLFEAGKMVNG